MLDCQHSGSGTAAKGASITQVRKPAYRIQGTCAVVVIGTLLAVALDCTPTEACECRVLDLGGHRARENLGGEMRADRKGLVDGRFRALLFRYAPLGDRALE